MDTRVKLIPVQAGNEQPCQISIRRRMESECHNMPRKKPKYLENVPGSSVMAIRPSAQTIQCKDRHVESQLPQYVTPGEYVLFELQLPKGTANEEKRSGYMKPSHGFRGESKIEKGLQCLISQDSKKPENYAMDHFLSQESMNDCSSQMGEYNMHVECPLHADSPLAFAIKEGWSDTFA